MDRLHVAILDEELPFPLTSGKRIRTFQLVSRLAESHRVSYLYRRPADAAEGEEARRVMESLGVECHAVTRPVPAKSGAAFAGRLAGNLLSPLPYSVATHAGGGFADAVEEFASRERVDLWHCEWTPYAEVLRRAGLDFRRWVVMAHNVESLIWRRYAESEANRLKRWYVRRQVAKYERFERWAYANATRAIAVSKADATLMREEFGGRNVEVVDNGVDVTHFRPGPGDDRNPHRLLFLGSLDWRPNLDAVQVLLDEVMPAVRAREPRATLEVVGRRPPEWLRGRSRQQPGVLLHADVDDVRPHLRRAGMMAVPLRIGGGSRLKILEALASGLPVVSTTVGAEGLALQPQAHYTRADGARELTEAILAGMREPVRMQQQAQRGRHRVVADYDWRPLAAKLGDVWRDAAARSDIDSRRIFLPTPEPARA